MARHTLGKRLEAAMDTAKVTAADLARLAGTTDATISNWLKDQVQADNVKATMLFRIADGVGADPRQLLLGESSRVAEQPAQYLSHPVQSERLTIAIQLVTEALAEANLMVPPARQAEAIKIAYELLEEDLPQAKVLRFVKAALG